MKKTINVLVVDDCKVTTQLLCTILNEEPDINVIACAKDGAAAVALTKELKPDLITMDIFMPNMDGVEATRAIMEQFPTPIIIISSHGNSNESEEAFNALQAGALSIIEKPQEIRSTGFSIIRRQLLNTVRALSEVRVMRRRTATPVKAQVSSFADRPRTIQLIALGSSTGGPEALHCILSALPADFPVPIVITQHITQGFLPGLINWLQKKTKLTVEMAQDHQKLYPGHVYFAIDNKHLHVKKSITPLAVFDNSEPIDHFKPSVNAMFTSIAKNYPGAAIGGLLTGMGQDGANGLLQMKEARCYTFAQSQATSIVYGMPGVAAAIKATDQLIDLENISQILAKLIQGR